MKGVIACACLCALVSTTVRAEATASHYRCLMPDGSVNVVAQDLSRLFTSAVRSCEAVATRAAAASPPLADHPVLPAAMLRAAGRGGAWVTLATGPVVRPMAPAALAPLVMEASKRYRLDYALLSALIYVESRYQPLARSPKGAIGLMQIMPATGARYGIDAPQRLLIPEVNIDVGARYLRDLHQLFDGRTELVLAAYNAGEGAVQRYGNRIPPYRETRDYVSRIMSMQRGE